MQLVKTDVINFEPQQVRKFLLYAKELTQEQILEFLRKYTEPDNEPDNPMRMIRKVIVDPSFDFLWEPQHEHLIEGICAKAMPEVINGVPIGLGEYRAYPTALKKALLKAFETSENRRLELADIFVCKEYRNFRRGYIAERRDMFDEWK